jgi:hypothetical protein
MRFTVKKLFQIDKSYPLFMTQERGLKRKCWRVREYVLFGNMSLTGKPQKLAVLDRRRRLQNIRPIDEQKEGGFT